MRYFTNITKEIYEQLLEQYKNNKYISISIKKITSNNNYHLFIHENYYNRIIEVISLEDFNNIIDMYEYLRNYDEN